MAFGFSGILILLLALPGFICRRFYYSGEFYKQYSSSKLVLTTFWSLLIGLILSLPSVNVYNALAESLGLIQLSNQNLSAFYCWVFIDSSKEDLSLYFIDFLFSTTHLYSIFLLLIVFFTISLLFGVGAKYLVRVSYSDMTIGFLKFQNYWSYYLRGRHIKFLRHGRRRLEYGTYLKMKVNFGENLVYDINGFLSSYELSPKTKDLEAVVLDTVKTNPNGTGIAGEVSNSLREDNGTIHVVPFSVIRSIEVLLVTLPQKELSSILLLRRLRPGLLILALFSPFIYNLDFFTSSLYHVTLGISAGLVLLFVTEKVAHLISVRGKDAAKRVGELIGLIIITALGSSAVLGTLWLIEAIAGQLKV